MELLSTRLEFAHNISAVSSDVWSCEGPVRNGRLRVEFRPGKHSSSGETKGGFTNYSGVDVTSPKTAIEIDVETCCSWER